MERPAPLPLPLEQVPTSIKRFCDPGAPLPARTLAARGAVPVGGSEQVMLLLQLAHDSVESLASAARESLERLPEAVLHTACDAPMPASFLDALAHAFPKRGEVLERIVANGATADATIAVIAGRCPERVSERIAVNEQRLLGAPKIIEALYRNKNTRMSTADRLIELAVRRRVRVDIPQFDVIADSILRGDEKKEEEQEPNKLPPEALDRALADAIATIPPPAPESEQGDESEDEDTKRAQLPLMMLIRTMTIPQKLRLALVGNATARATLVKDKSKVVSSAAISSPAMTENEVPAIARSKESAEDILRYIANKREWMKNYEIKYALLFNPKTPPGLSLRFLPHMRDPDLKALSRSKNVPGALRSAAMGRLQTKERKEKGK